MKKLGLLGKFLFFINSIAALLLLLAYVLPFIPPNSFPYISLLSLGMPVLIAVNLLFCLYWLLRMRRQFLLSLIILLIGFNHLSALYKFKSEERISSEESLKMMSYNVRQFNRYDWMEDKDIPQKIKDFILKESADVVCIQEYASGEIDFSAFPHTYKKIIAKGMGQAILSKYPIINKGSLDFKNTGNNVIYADIVVKEDTLRVFNMHLQSHKIDQDLRNLDKEKGKELTKKMGGSFKIQQDQAEMFLTALAESPYPNIVAGDMNNTAFSYAYRKLTANLNDAFKEKGKGLGYTFMMDDFLPLRIDYFLVDPKYKIVDFTTYREKLSDHYPIAVQIEGLDIEN